MLAGLLWAALIAACKGYKARTCGFQGSEWAAVIDAIAAGEKHDHRLCRHGGYALFRSVELMVMNTYLVGSITEKRRGGENRDKLSARNVPQLRSKYTWPSGDIDPN